MALGYVSAVRNAQLDEITAAVGTSGKVRIYSGTRPATGGTAATLLAELACSATFAPAASGGVLTVNALTQDSSADATGTASWFRVLTSADVPKVDGSVTATGGGGDLQLNSVSVTAGGIVTVTSFTVTAGNA
jgi:hypothetical protein